jgi:AcrR family transcriptional regulator
VIEMSHANARAAATRDMILATAERLFAQQGIEAVSNRQVSEAAGQGNNTAVGYHFGTKTDLVRAIAREHSSHVDAIRQRLLDEYGDSTRLRDWVAVAVRPITDHLAALGSPCWYARFAVQLMAHPVLREIVIEDARSSPSVQAARDGLAGCLTDIPPAVLTERGAMMRTLILNTCADHEREAISSAATWDSVATGLIDALAGLLSGPVTTRPRH